MLLSHPYYINYEALKLAASWHQTSTHYQSRPFLPKRQKIGRQTDSKADILSYTVGVDASTIDTMDDDGSIMAIVVLCGRYPAGNAFL